MDRKQIEAGLRKIIGARVPKVKADDLVLDAELALLGVDSLAFSWIIADMEETFGFAMRGGDIMKLKTLASTIDYVETQMKK